MKYASENRRWIRWLGDVIEQELGKPQDQMNMKLISECEALIGELMAVREDTKSNAAVMEARLIDIKSSGYALPPRRAWLPARIGKLAACVALAAVVGLGGALAAVSAVSALREDEGSPPTVTETTDSTELVIRDPEVTWEGIRYTSLGETVNYGDIETLLTAQALEIPYPTVLPEGVSITAVAVDVTADPATVTYGFSEPTLTMTVVLNTAADAEALAQSGEIHMAGGMVSYLSADGNGYRATVIGAGTVATVESLSRETVLTVLDGMAEHTPVDPSWTDMAIHDGYLYFTETRYLSRTYEVIRRMDLRTGEISDVCAAEGCTHERDRCPFYRGRLRGFMIFGDWMHVHENYYWNQQDISSQGMRESQFLYNLKTGEVRKLPAILRDSFKSVRVGNCLYLVKHGNKLTYSDGVTRTYCKVYEYNIDTDEYRIVYEHNDLIALLYGSNTRVYFFQEVATAETSEITYYSFNPETGEMREEPTVAMRTPDAIYRSRLYCREYDSETYTHRLLLNDVTTGETAVISPEGFINFSITENGIYYFCMEEYAAYLEVLRRRTEQYNAEMEAPDQSGKSRSEVRDAYERDQNLLIAQYLMPYKLEIRYCDLTGGNPVKKYEIPFVLTGTTKYIENDTLYAMVKLIDPATGESLTREDGYVPVTVDLISGEMTVLTPDALK